MSPLHFTEKSDLVDTILTCRGQPAIQDTRTAPPVTTPPSGSTAAGSSFGRPSRSRPGDSSRAGPYESIRVRAVDTDEDFEPSAPSCPPSPTASAERLPTRYSSDPAAATADADSDADDVRPAADVRTSSGVDVEGGTVNTARPDVEPAETPAAAEEAARGASEAEPDGEDVEAMDDDPDEPQSEAVEEEASVADDSTAEDGKAVSLDREGAAVWTRALRSRQLLAGYSAVNGACLLSLNSS